MTHTPISKWNFTNVLTRIPTYVGCSDFPSTSQGMSLIAIISEFINDEFPLMKPDDITNAFKAAASGKLMDNGRKIEPNTYGQYLSAGVVGKVLSAYKDFNKGERSRPQGYNPNQIQSYKGRLDTPHTPITPIEAYELIFKWCNADNALPFVAPYDICYQYLLEKKAVRKVSESKRTGRYAGMHINLKRQSVEQYFIKNVLNKAA